MRTAAAYVSCTHGGPIRKQLTITIDERLHERLHGVIGAGKISRFIENAVLPLLTGLELETAYREMGRDEASEAEALEWSERLIGDGLDEER